MWPNFKKTLQKHPIPFPQKQAKGKYMYISFIDYFFLTHQHKDILNCLYYFCSLFSALQGRYFDWIIGNN